MNWYTKVAAFPHRTLSGASAKYVIECGKEILEKKGRWKMAVKLRDLTTEEKTTLEQMLHARKVPAGKQKRAQVIWLASQGLRPSEIAQQLQVSEGMVRKRLHRFNEEGLQGLEEAPRSGRPPT